MTSSPSQPPTVKLAHTTFLRLLPERVLPRLPALEAIAFSQTLILEQAAEPEAVRLVGPGVPCLPRRASKGVQSDIPLNEREQWEEWLNNRRAEHREWTDVIIRLEI
jgi:hypothetical protein